MQQRAIFDRPIWNFAGQGPIGFFPGGNGLAPLDP
jgi:hypothetical protein